MVKACIVYQNQWQYFKGNILSISRMHGCQIKTKTLCVDNDILLATLLDMLCHKYQNSLGIFADTPSLTQNNVASSLGSCYFKLQKIELLHIKLT